MKPRLIFIVGPTGSGKTAVAVRLAPLIKAGIVSCDSMQVYRGMEILTSKPSPAELKKAAHYCLGIVSPAKEFNVSMYRGKAMRVLNELRLRRKIPLFVGGTGLYVSAIVDGIFRRRTENALVRQKLTTEGLSRGSARLHERLFRVDPQAARKIHPNDLRRIVRALEVYTVAGKPISELQRQRKGLWDAYDIRIFCLSPQREILYKRINRRVDRMFKAGLVEEVRALLKKKLSRTAALAIGLREVAGYQRGDYGLEQAADMIKLNTRRYAKRQLTWFRRDKRVEWIEYGQGVSPAKLAQRIRAKIKKEA